MCKNTGSDDQSKMLVEILETCSGIINITICSPLSISELAGCLLVITLATATVPMQGRGEDMKPILSVRARPAKIIRIPLQFVSNGKPFKMKILSKLLDIKV